MKCTALNKGGLMSVCSFFGHRKVDNSEELIDRLTLTIRKVLDEGVRTFYFGGFGEFDDLCWRVVTELKKEYIDIIRVFCLSDERHLRVSKRPFIWIFLSTGGIKEYIIGTSK